MLYNYVPLGSIGYLKNLREKQNWRFLYWDEIGRGAYMEKENERAHASGYQPDLRF
jgi:hypothetical protein